MITRLRLFHKDEQGQIIYLTVVSVVVFLSLAALIINSGNAVTRKLETQNAVDAGVVSGATWIARGMNNISRNNITMTQALALIVILDALKDTGERGSQRAQILMVGARLMCSIPFTAAVGCPWLAALQVADVFFQGINALGSSMEVAKRGLWALMEVLDKMSFVIKNFFPLIAYEEANNIGIQNRAEGIQMYPWFPSMPVDRREFSDLCHPTRVGSPGSYPRSLQRGYHPLIGYNIDEGPLLSMRKTPNSILTPFLWIILSPRLFTDRTESRFGDHCRGTPSGDYSSYRQTPAAYLLKGAGRSTNRSTSILTSAKQDLNYLGIAWRPTESIFMQAKFVNPQKYICSYGQVRVFNSTSFDLFTQDWRVKLVKADLLDADPAALLTMAGKCGNLSLALAKSLNHH